MADYGFKVSKPGFDVKTATFDNLALSSSFNSYKVYAQGSGSISVPNPGATLQISHALAYPPSFLFWYQNDLGVWTIGDGSQDAILISTGPSVYTAYCASDTNVQKFIVTFLNSSLTTYSIPYYYYLFLDTL